MGCEVWEEVVFVFSCLTVFESVTQVEGCTAKVCYVLGGTAAWWLL